MTRDEAVAQVQQLMRFRTNLVPTIEVGLREAQNFYEEGPLEPWFLRSERSFIFTQINEERIPLPNNFLRETDESGLWYVPDDGSGEVELDKDEIDVLRTRFSGQAPGRPTNYAIDSKYFRLFATPNAAYRVKMIYMKKDVALTSNIENLWLEHAPWLLIGRAGRIIAASTGDKFARDEFAGLESSGLSAISAKTEARELDNRRLQMGGRI